MSPFEREVKRGKVPIPMTHRMMDIALNEAMLSVTESLILDHTAFGIQRQRTGGRMEGIAPSNAYLCIEGSIVIAGNGDAIFRRYMDVIARRDLATTLGCKPTQTDGNGGTNSTTPSVSGRRTSPPRKLFPS